MKPSTNTINFKTPFYKKASFPWAIIIGATILLIGIGFGWTLRQTINEKVSSEATIRVNQVSKMK